MTLGRDTILKLHYTTFSLWPRKNFAPGTVRRQTGSVAILHYTLYFSQGSGVEIQIGCKDLLLVKVPPDAMLNGCLNAVSRHEIAIPLDLCIGVPISLLLILSLVIACLA